ncbi:MAG: patatin-like phospholipase family protein [Actinomycetota bacterium]|nr:patatin-like phospholipase family protein [Actinomycetota bacterium]
MPRVGLVLGAGGVAGQAYHLGVLSALTEATGWDPRDVALVVGTSAGSVTGALLRAGLSVEDQAARAMGRRPSAAGRDLVERLGPRPPTPGPGQADLPPGPSAGLGGGVLRSVLARPWDARAGTLLAAALPRGRTSNKPLMAGLDRLYGDRWPNRPLWLPAVRLANGARVVFGNDGGRRPRVAEAVAASCAIPGYFAPVSIEGVDYVDGGAHSPSNLDLLAGEGLDLVVVSSPMSISSGALRPRLDAPVRLQFRRYLSREAAKVTRAGTPVVSFQPNAADLDVLGFNAMDPRRSRAVLERVRETTRQRLAEPALRQALAALSG